MQTLWTVSKNLQKIPQIAVSAIDRFVIIKVYEVHGGTQGVTGRGRRPARAKSPPAAFGFGRGTGGLRPPFPPGKGP